jgi:eukaryotic-like serine/threonine-protein kinase
MTPERWRQIEEIFHGALDRAPADRSEFLDRHCGGDAELRAEVESLLAEQVADAFLAVPIGSAAHAVSRQTADARIGQRLGAYRLTGLIGQGGMGAVYRGVRDDDQYRKQVAVKLVKLGMDTESLLRRFRHERQILASLDHPHIARLLDGGSTDDGLPYLVMEYIEGQPITSYCEGRTLTISERLRLFLQVCAAVAYAHKNLVVHRDLKPGNVLVTDAGAPKLLDFGIAKLLSGEDEDAAPKTVTALHMMTPDYASPEQVRGLPITTATDIYSLGAVLYELLSGERAHRFKSYSPGDIERSVCGTDVEKPSTAVRRATGSARLRRHLAGDIDNIVLMAMRKEPERRYSSVDQFADDIRRYLEKRPIVARQDTFGYRAGKFLRRNRVAVASAGVIVLSLVGGMTMTAYQARRAERQFQQVRRLANTVLFELSDQIAALPGSTQARELVAKTGLEYLDSLASEAAGDPALQLELAEGYYRLALVQGGFRVPGLEQFDAALASYRKALGLGQQLLARAPHDAGVLSLMLKCRSNLGDILQERGDLATAAAEMREAARLVEALALQSDLTLDQLFDVIVLLHFDGDLQLKLGRRQLAEQRYREALAWDQRVMARFPGPRAQHSFSLDLATLGDALAAGGDLNGAMEQYHKALAVRLENVQQNPDNIRYRRELALLYSWMGHFTGSPIRMSLGDRAKAEAYYRKNLEITEKLAAEDPKNAQGVMDLAFSYEHVGNTVDNPREAVGLYRKALAVLAPLLEKSPGELRYQRRNASALRLLAVALHRSGERAEAREQMREALVKVRALVSSQPANELLKVDLHASVLSSANLRVDTGARTEALGELQEALEIGEAMRKARPDDLDWEWRLAETYSALARHHTAVAGDPPSLPARRAAALRESCDWRRKALAVWEGWRVRAVSSAFDVTRRELAARAVAECTSLDRALQPNSQ